MASRLTTPWWLDRHVGDARAFASGSVAATPLLDWGSRAVLEIVERLDASNPISALQQAHGLIATQVRPVYALNDRQPVSKTLARGRGSCSQRLAALEAVARAVGVPTRVRGLLVDGRFWYPRFPRIRFAVPDAVVLAWPEFLVADNWVPVSELFGPVGSLSGDLGFSNSGGETLFDAVSRTAVDWDGESSTPGVCSACDQSASVLMDLGRFDSRDELFAQHGQTLCWGVRTLAEPVLSRRRAGATTHP